MANFVQLYRSTDTNAPSLTGQVGSLVTLLNKCLVDGYTAASVTSITRSGTTATVTMAASNTTFVTGNYVKIAGANEADYNGTFQITVLSTTQFTYTVANSPTTPATGTITYAKAGLGWTKPFAAGTNAQTYRSADSSSNQFYLQVIDNGATAGGAKEAQVYGAEVMTADQTVSSGRFPTAAQMASGLGWYKSSTADGTARVWALIGDDRTFYLWVFNTTIGSNVTDKARMYGFGYFIPYKSGDGYNTFIVGEAAFNSSNTTNVLGYYSAINATSQTVTNSGWIARAYSQAGGSVAANLFGAGWAGSPGNSGTNFFNPPNQADCGYYFVPTTIWEANTGPPLRGRMPGFYCPIFNSYGYLGGASDYWVTINLTSPSAVNLMQFPVSNGAGSSSGTTYYGSIFIDMFGPWT